MLDFLDILWIKESGVQIASTGNKSYDYHYGYFNIKNNKIYTALA